jgi:hypothetical protein
MTDDQIERAALRLCEIRGWKPHSLDHLQVRGAADPLEDAVDHCKREIIAFYQVAKALDSVLGDDLK